MNTPSSPLSVDRSIIGAIRTVPIHPRPGIESPEPMLPFVTISRQPYSGAWTFAQQLVEALNVSDPGVRPWTCWDRELVEKVAADHHMSKELIEAIEDGQHSWLIDFLSSLSFVDGPEAADVAKAYERIATTVRKLAAGGRVVIVGRGGVFITRRMRGGIHIRLVAPFEDRVAFMIRQLGTRPQDAPSLLQRFDRNRLAFLKRYWPSESVVPETFAATLNTSQLDTTTMIQIVQSLIRQRVAAAR